MKKGDHQFERKQEGAGKIKNASNIDLKHLTEVNGAAIEKRQS